MKVLIVHYYIGQGGGAETAVRNQTKALMEQGVEVEVTAKDPFLLPSSTLKGIDLIHFHTIHVSMNLNPLVESRKRGIPHCISLHDYWPFCTGRMLLTGFDQSCSAVEGVCDGQCQFGPTPQHWRDMLKGTPTITFNPTTAEIFDRHNIDVTAVIPHGIDTDFFSCSSPGDGRDWSKIVTVAAWASHPSKGMHILKRALSESKLSATLVTGKPHEVVRDTLCSAGIFVFPSVYEETFGLSLVEAMSCGCACITSNVAGPLNIVDHMNNGIIVPKRDIKALVNAMAMLHNDPLLCWQLGSEARRKALKEYNLTLYGKRLKEFYESLL